MIRKDTASYASEFRATDYFEQQGKPRELSAEGFLVLHAALLECQGRAFGLVGPSGIGKSSLSAGLQRLGWTLRGDDTMTLRTERSGHLAMALARRLRLNPDSAQAIVGGDRPICGIDSFGKHVFHLPEAQDAQPIRAFFLLDVSPTGDTRVERLKPSAACATLVANSFAQDPAHLQDAGRRLGFAAEIAADVPVFRLSYPRDFGAIPKIAAAIARTLRTHPPDQEA